VWSVAAQHALLDHLASMIDQKANSDPGELWLVRKGERELRCVLHYLPTGIDVRLLEGDDFRRTQLGKIGPAVEKLSGEWLKALVEVGGTSRDAPSRNSFAWLLSDVLASPANPSRVNGREGSLEYT
jgi:hypothetical protein